MSKTSIDFFNSDEIDKFAKAILDRSINFIEKDNVDNIYKVLEYKTHFSSISEPYCYCRVIILDKKAFYNYKNKVHNLSCKNPVGLHPTFINFKLDVKEF